MSALELAFDAIYLTTALIQSGHCIDLLFRHATPLKSTTYLLLAASLIYVMTWSISIAGDIGLDIILNRPPRLGVDGNMVERTLNILFAGGILGAFAFAFVSAAIFRAVAAAGEGKAKTLLWIGIGVVTLLAIFDIASLSFNQALSISDLHLLDHPSHYSRSQKIAIALGLGIPAIIFQVIFLVVLGKAGAPYKQHPSLYLVPTVIFPITIIRVLIAVINAILDKVTLEVPDLYYIWTNIVISGIEPVIVGCILRIAYIWNAEESHTVQVGGGSKTALLEG